MEATERKLDLRFGALIIATHFVDVYDSIWSSWYRLFTVPFFSVRSSSYRPLRTAILVSNVLRGRVSGFIAVAGGGRGRPTPCQKEGQLTWYLSPGYNLGQKVLRILHFLTHRRPTLRIWHHGDPSPPLPGQCCLVGGKGEVSWVNRALEGSILKLDIQGTFFLTFLSEIVGSLPAQDVCPQGQVLVSYDLTEK